MVQGKSKANGRPNGYRSTPAATAAATGDTNGDMIVPARAKPQVRSVASSPEVTRRQSALLQSLRGDPQFCDAILVVDSHETKVHRAVLSQLSPFFRRILQQCAAAGSGHGVPRITLQHASVVSTAVLVDYAYGLDVTESCSRDIDVALDVANLAATLTIDGLCEIAIRSALSCAKPEDYPRVFYAFKLFGKNSDAQKVLQRMARDGNLWIPSNANTRVGGGIDRMAPQDLLQLVVSPELTTSEDDLFTSLANWVSVDPQVRAHEFVRKFLPHIRPQRLTHKSHAHLQKLTRVAPIPHTILANMLADTLAKPIAVPAGSDLGANVTVAKIHPSNNNNNKTTLGCALDWLSEQGSREFEKSLLEPIPRAYPVTTIHAQHYFLSVYEPSATNNNSNIDIGCCTRDYYVDFVSLCVHFRVEISADRFLLHVGVERRNKMHRTGSGETRQFPSLDDSLKPVAILCETTVSFLPGTPLESAFGAWPAQQLAARRQNKPAETPPAKKRQRTAESSMELVGSAKRRKRIMDALNTEENALSISVCLRTTKMSLLKNKGLLDEKKDDTPSTDH